MSYCKSSVLSWDECYVSPYSFYETVKYELSNLLTSWLHVCSHVLIARGARVWRSAYVVPVGLDRGPWFGKQWENSRPIVAHLIQLHSCERIRSVLVPTA